MTDLLSKEEYAAIAADIKFPVEPFIDGKFHKPGAGKTMETINPATGRVLAEVCACDATDENYAVVDGVSNFTAHN